jgi:hypothetical protein
VRCAVPGADFPTPRDAVSIAREHGSGTVVAERCLPMNPPPRPTSHVTATNAYAFTPAELARLVAYRGAIAAGLYSDFPTPGRRAYRPDLTP